MQDWQISFFLANNVQILMIYLLETIFIYFEIIQRDIFIVLFQYLRIYSLLIITNLFLLVQFLINHKMWFFWLFALII